MNLYKQLVHPQVCALIEAGECEGAPVIVSRYVLGKSLLDLMVHYRVHRMTARDRAINEQIYLQCPSVRQLSPGSQ